MANVGYHLETAWFQKPPLGVQLKRGHPLTEGLVGCWLFNEGGGDKAYDLSGYGNHGTLKQMAFPSTTISGWNPGMDGVGLAFDSSCIECGTTLGNGFSQITIETWTKRRTFGAFQNIVGKWEFGGDPPNNSYGLNYVDTDVQNIHILTTGIKNVAGPTITDTDWHHTVATYDGANIYLYVDDVQYGPTAQTGAIATTTKLLKIGNDDSGPFDRYFNGYISYVRIWNRALSPSEAQQLYIYPYAMFEPVSTYALVAEVLARPQSNLAAMAMLG